MTEPSSASDGWDRSASWTWGSKRPLVSISSSPSLRSASWSSRTTSSTPSRSLLLLVLRGGHERSLEVVEHRQELLHQPLVGARDQSFLVTRAPLAVVVEVGRDPLEVGDALVALRLDLGESPLELLDGVVLRASVSSTASGVFGRLEAITSA